MSLVLDAARRAFDTIPLYRALYGSRPESEADVPFLSISAFHRAGTPLDIIASTETIRGVIPAYSRHARRLPVTILESEAEWTLRLERFRHALSVLGAAPEAWPPLRDRRGRGDRPLRQRHRQLPRLGPRRMLGHFPLGRTGARRSHTRGARAGYRHRRRWRACRLPSPEAKSRPELSTCVHADNPPDGLVEMDRLLVSDELFVIGAARAGDTSYEFDPRSVLIESDPASGRLAVTTTAFDCLALVRYCLEFPLPPTGDHAHAGL